MKHAQELKAVIFDLDGTLVNSVLDVRLALNKTLAFYGHDPLSIERVSECLGQGAYALLENAFAKSGTQLNANDMPQAVEHYLACYKADPVVETQIYPDVIEVLTELKQQGVHLAVCTNKPGVMTRLVLNKLNLSSFFSVQISGDEVMNPKPHASHLQAVLRQLHVPADQAVMVGDSEVDQLAAYNANVAFIGVNYGYASTPLQDSVLIDHFRELPAALAQSFASREVVA